MKPRPRRMNNPKSNSPQWQSTFIAAAVDPTHHQEDLTFRPSADTSLGVELELQILDRESGDLAPGAVRLLQACREEAIDGVTAELLQSMIEVKTGVCRNVDEVRNSLVPAPLARRQAAASGRGPFGTL